MPLRVGFAIALPADQIQFLRHACIPQPGRGGLVRGDEPHLRTQFRAHVRQRHALLHGQRANGLAAELHRLIAPAVHAIAADHVQHHVLGGDAGGQLAAPMHHQRLGHLDPDLAGDRHAQHLSAADAEHIGAESAAGRRMRIAAHAEHAGPDVPVLRHHHVADAHGVIHVGQLLLRGPIARDAHDAARFVVGLRHVVVDDQHDPGRVPQRGAQLFQHGLQAPRAAGIVEHRQIDRTGHDFALGHRLAPAGGGDQLLGQGLRLGHDYIPR